MIKNSHLIFLKTLIINKNEYKKNLLNAKFRNLSIITSLNTQKDQINNLGPACFAIDSKQQLTHFFLVD